jgi:PAS domain S-box-containing protein
LPAPAFAATSESSTGTGVTRDGLEYSWFRRQSPVTGWFVSIGVPQAELSAPARRSFLIYGVAGGALLAGSLGLAYHLGGRLAQSAGALGIDRTPTREEFRVLFEFAPNGVVVVDSDDNIALVNEHMETMFRYRREELIGRSIKSLIPDRLLGNYGRPALTTARRARVSGAWRDLRGRRKDGTEFPIELGLNPISTPGGNMVIATMVDITARQEAAERLANTIAERDDLRRRLMQAQEDERLRLAHELHDQTGQSLTAVMLQLKSVESTTTEEGRDRLRLLRKQLEEMGKTLHRVAWELRPASIDELGLSSALTNYVADWSAQVGIEADFHCRDTRLDLLPEEVRTTVYRVVQEALTNIAKHATGTTAVSVVLDRSEGILRLTIEDDGHGFDPASPNERDRRGGLGIAGMRERLALIGGELVVESSVGVGTTIFARVPLEHERLIA